MTITEMTNTQMLFSRAAANIARRNAAAARQSGSADSNGGSGQGGGGSSDATLAKVSSANQNPPAATEATTAPAATDTVDLSTGASTAAATAGGSQPFNGLVEQYVRTRSAMSFNLPGVGGFGSMSFAYEVETAYRVIRPLQPGEVVDLQA